MNLAAKMTGAYLDARGLRYFYDESQPEVIRTGFGGLKNKQLLEILCIFGEDGSDVAIRSFNFCNVPTAKLAEAHAFCSEMNKLYRWVKFYIDENDNTVTLADDAVIQLDSCGEEVFELILRMAQIADDAYVQFMKLIWS